MKNCLLIQGGDAFDLETHLAQFKPKTCDEDLRFDGADLSAGALEEALFSPSFFSETFVLIENGQDLSGKAQELVRAFAKKPSPKVWLLVHATGKCPLDMPVKEIAEVKPWDKQAKIVEWIQAYLKEKKVHPQVPMMLATTQDRFLLRQELDKLLCYVGEAKEITPDDVQAISALDHEHTVWQLSDAFLSRDRAQAVTLLHQLLEQQVSSFLIVRQLRNACHQALMMLNVENPQEHFPQLRGKIFDKTYRLAKEAGSAFLTKALLRLDKAELALKDSPFDEEALLYETLSAP